MTVGHDTFARSRFRVARVRFPSRSLAIVALAAAAFAAGHGLHGGWAEDSPTPTPNPILIAREAVPSGRSGEATTATHRPDFHFVDQAGVRRDISDWDQRVVVVNFWATWCPPCLVEIPVLVTLQSRFEARGVQFVGIALDDPEAVHRYAAQVGLNYPTAHDGDGTAPSLLQRFGGASGGLPFTVLIDRHGNIVHRHAGPLTADQLEGLLQAQLSVGRGDS